MFLSFQPESSFVDHLTTSATLLLPASGALGVLGGSTALGDWHGQQNADDTLPAARRAAGGAKPEGDVNAIPFVPMDKLSEL